MSHISRDEFRRALYKLKMSGSFSHQEINEVENIFYSSLHEGGSSAGISSEELKKSIRYLKHHPENHHLSHDEIEKLEEVMRHYL
jgi:tellurite resistance protein